MNSFSSNFIKTKGNKEYKDRLFKAIFGRDNEQSKRWRLDLYNALNDSNYTDPDALELNTIENVIYINEKHNISLQKKCKPLYDYVRFVSRINHNWDELGMPMNEAVDEAANWAEKENLLDGLISSEKDEVIGMILTEFNEEAFIKTCQEDGYERGKQEKAVEDARNFLMKGIDSEIIAECTGLTLEEVQKLAEGIAQTTA